MLCSILGSRKLSRDKFGVASFGMIYVPRSTRNLAGGSNCSCHVHRKRSPVPEPTFFRITPRALHCSMLWISVPNPLKRARRGDCSHCSIQHLSAHNSRLFHSSGFPFETFQIGSGLWQGLTTVAYFSY